MHSRAVLVTLALLAALGPAAARPDEQTRNPEPVAQKAEPKALVSGFLQVDYRLGNGDGQKSAVKNEFNTRRARLVIGGKINERVGYGLAVQGDGLNPNTGSLLDAFVDLSFKPLAKLRAGQFKYEFDMQGREVAPVMPFMDRPFVTNAVAGSMDGVSTASVPAAAFRDRGVSLWGDSKRGGVTWGYALGLYQGSGRASDNNSALGYALHLHVLPLKDLRLNGAYLSSETQNQGTPDPASYRAWTIGAGYDAKRWMARAEYYHGDRDRDATRQVVKGYYVLGVITAISRLDLMARYQELEDGQFRDGADRARSVDLGAKWYLVRQGKRAGTHLALNYMLRDADAGFSKGVTLLNDGRGAALSSGRSVKGVLMLRLQAQF